MANQALKFHDRLQKIYYFRLGLIIFGALFLIGQFVHAPTWDSYMAEGLKAANSKNYKEAEAAYSKALGIAKKFIGDDDRFPETMYNLAIVYLHEDRNAEAGEIFKTLLAMRQRKFGVDSVEATPSMRNLAVHYVMNQKPAEAEALFQHALKIWDKDPSDNRPNVIVSLNNLATFYTMRKDYKKAQPLLITRYDLGHLGSDPDVSSQYIKRLAENHLALSQFDQAVPFLKKWLELQSTEYAHDRAAYCEALLTVAKIYTDNHHPDMAEPYLKKAVGIGNDIYLGLATLPRMLFRAADIYAEGGDTAMAESLRGRAEALQKQYDEVLNRAYALADRPAQATAPTEDTFSSPLENEFQFGKYRSFVSASKNKQ